MSVTGERHSAFGAHVVTPVIVGAPGELVHGDVVITNVGTTPARFHVRAVGLDGRERSAGTDVEVAAGADVTVAVPLAVPGSLGVGEHAAAFEITSSRPGDRAALVPIIISIGSVERVDLVPVPATVRGRRGKLRLDVANREPHPVRLTLEADAPDLVVRFRDGSVELEPGAQTSTKVTMRGVRRLTGEPRHHTLLLRAHGRASSTSTTVTFVERPLVARRVRSLVAAITVISLWLGAIAGVALWWSGRADDTETATAPTLVDTDGDGVPDEFRFADGSVITAVDTDGDGVPDEFTLPDGSVVRGVDTDGDGVIDSFVDAAGNPVPDPTGGAAASAAGGAAPGGDGGDDVDDADEVAGPAVTVVRGRVTAAGADVTDVAITLTPIELGAPVPGDGSSDGSNS